MDEQTTTYKVSTVSQQLDMTPAGLRKWCELYRDFLSDAATPRRGATRRFTAADVRTLEAIATMRSADLSHDQIKLRLADAAQDAEPGQPAPLPEAPAPLATVPDQVRTADLVKFENVMELRSQNAELSRRVDRLTWLVYGAVVLLVLTLVAVLAIVALAN